MKYLPTAFAQLGFAWKLYNYALDKKIKLNELDIPITFKDTGMVLVLPDKIFDSYNDLILACENNLTIAFGAAIITLNRSREEAPYPLPDPIESEGDQFVSLAYQIRNAFAHDISEPTWCITKKRYCRAYEFGGIRVDLSNIENGMPFQYQHIGGPDVLFHMYEYATENLFPVPPPKK